MDKVQRVKQLEGLIIKHSDLYYNDQAEISDAAFDDLQKELRNLDPTNKVLRAVGAVSPDNWPRAAHKMFMGSLHKAMDISEMKDWWRKRLPKSGVTVSEKMDGFSLELVYEEGVLIQAITRGDGLEGSDITSNMAFYAKGRFLKLAKPITDSFRAEGMILNSAFEKYFKQVSKPDGSRKYTNPRNTASGLIKSKNPEDLKMLEHFSLFFYDTGDTFEFDSKKMRLFETLGLPVPKWFEAQSIAAVEEIYNDYVEKSRAGCDYEIDGLVVKIRDTDESAKWGITDQRPNGQIALKFPAQSVLAKINEISWELGDSGRFCPVAVIEPTWNGRVTLRNATCHNIDYLREKNITAGATVEVYQAGDIIPQIKSVVEPGNGELSIPTHCPVCKTPVELQDSYHVCPNLDCPQKELGRIKYYVESVGIKFTGDSLLEEMHAKGIIKDASDLYKLTAEDFKKIERKGEKHFDKFKHYLDKTIEMDLATLLGSVGIDQAKVKTMERIVAAGYDTLDKVYAASPEELSRIPLIKDRAYPIYEGLKRFRPVVDRLVKNGVKITKVNSTGGLVGKSFLFTGAVEVINPITGKRFKREELEILVKEHGGTVASGVSKVLSYLVQADVSSESSKSKKARELGVPCITDVSFLEMVK